MNNKIGGDFITFHYRHRKEIIIGIIISFILGTGVFLYFNNKEEKVESSPIITKKKVSTKKETTIEEKVLVDIKGEVNVPGIYSMNANLRVMDAIDKAGGLTENADTTVINLSKKIQDEMVIIIYSKEQVKNFEETKKKEEQVQEKCIQSDENSLKNDACIKDTPTESKKININTATKEELMTLPGIGEAKAKDIISYREKNGGFKSIEDIKKVTGIGDNVFSQIQETITVG